MKEKAWKKKALELYGAGTPVKQIAEMLKKDYHTVYIALKRLQQKEKQKENKLQEYYTLLKSEGIVDRLNNMLQLTTERKGKYFPISISKLYSGLKPTLKLLKIDIGRSRFYELIKYIIYHEFGTIETLNNIIHNTPTRNRVNKGTIRRKLDTLEIDATGITIDGVMYSVVFAIDVATSYIFPPYIVQATERKVKYYNTAINSIDIAKYLRDLFIDFGVPKVVKTDNEETLSAEIIKRAFKQLSIKHERTVPYNPQAKHIERVIRTIKDSLAFFKNMTAEEQIRKAVDFYNNEEHKFKVYPEPIRPADIFSGYEKVDESMIRKAFRERFVRTIRDNTIKIDNKTYEIFFPETKIFDVYGRTNERKVVCYRDIENNTILDVYSEDESRYYGVAKLITQTEILDALQERQQKNKEKRLQRREAKLKQELTHIEQEREQKQTHQIDFSILEQPSTQEEKQEELSDLPDILELFGR